MVTQMAIWHLIEFRYMATLSQFLHLQLQWGGREGEIEHTEAIY